MRLREVFYGRRVNYNNILVMAMLPNLAKKILPDTYALEPFHKGMDGIALLDRARGDLVILKVRERLDASCTHDFITVYDLDVADLPEDAEDWLCTLLQDLDKCGAEIEKDEHWTMEVARRAEEARNVIIESVRGEMKKIRQG